MRRPSRTFSRASLNVAENMLAAGADSAVAILHKDSLLTYGGLRETVLKVATGLLVRGHRKGDRIGILSENSLFQIIAYLAVIRAGLVAVPLPPDLSIEALASIARDAEIKDVFASSRLSARAQGWAATTPIKVLGEADLLPLQQHGVGTFPEIDPDRDLAALMFTSGSTGTPKGVMISHRNIDCNAGDIVSYMGLTAADRVMVVLPFYYCFGASLLHTHLEVGGSLVLSSDFRLFPETTLQELRRTACTGLAGVPSTYQILLRKSRFPQMIFPNLRWFQQAGGKLPNHLIQELLTSFPKVCFYLMYGQTEATARLSYLPPARLADKLGSVGCGLPSTQLEVLKPDGTPVTPGSDQTGEIVATGKNVALGYWNDPEETRKFFKDGKLHTGDIARVDSEGFIFIVEREREIIKSGGNRVSSKEIEEVIAELPEVMEVAVLGKPDDILGEAVYAFITVAPGVSLTPQEVQSYCRKRLPLFKVPYEVQIIEQMPHNSSGKILKLALKEVMNTHRPVQGAVAAGGASGHGEDPIEFVI